MNAHSRSSSRGSRGSSIKLVLVIHLTSLCLCMFRRPAHWDPSGVVEPCHTAFLFSRLVLISLPFALASQHVHVHSHHEAITSSAMQELHKRQALVMEKNWQINSRKINSSIRVSRIVIQGHTKYHGLIVVATLAAACVAAAKQHLCQTLKICW